MYPITQPQHLSTHDQPCFPSSHWIIVKQIPAIMSNKHFFETSIAFVEMMKIYLNHEEPLSMCFGREEA